MKTFKMNNNVEEKSKEFKAARCMNNGFDGCNGVLLQT
jgi:hypothetical protein